MTLLNGNSISNGIAIGPVFKYENSNCLESDIKSESPEIEIKKYLQAKEAAITELNELSKKTAANFGNSHAEIFNSHIMILEDSEFISSVQNIIRSKNANAISAVLEAGSSIANMFSNMNDEIISAKSTDVIDVANRIVRILNGQSKEPFSLCEQIHKPVILVAKELTPSEIIQLKKEYILGIITQFGNAYSHSSILARAMGIPSITGVNIHSFTAENIVIIDGERGEIIINPDDFLMEEYKTKQFKQLEINSSLNHYLNQKTVTKSGKKIKLYANVGSLEEASLALKNGAEGIGLFRSEYLYINRETLPSEEEQFIIYKDLLETMNGKNVIIRTADIGSDKQIPYLNCTREENPALGYRGIRISLGNKEIFKTQLRALFRASAYGHLSIMYPMISSLDEVLEIKDISNTLKEELFREGYPLGKVKEGIMIETPAAALISDILADYVDFFSIGTNDLTQYTLAMDRLNSKLASSYNPHHPAVIKLIKLICENAEKADIEVGICGELGADTFLTEELIAMGIKEFSVASNALLEVKKAICESN